MILRPSCLVATIVVFFSITACTWVDLSDAGKQVTIVPADTVATCKKMGHVSAKTRYHLVGDTERDRQKVLQEIQTLARNEAPTIQANTLVEDGPPIKGQQRFIAYACP